MLKDKFSPFIKFCDKHKRTFLISSLLIVFMLIINVGFPHSVLATETIENEKPGVAEKTFAAMIRGVAWALDNLFFQGDKLKLDTIIYNNGADGYGLTLMQQSDLRDFIIQYYLVIQYLAVTFFVPLGLWIAIDFKKAKENPQHIVMLKDRLMKWIITFFLITGIPTILGIIFTFNGVLVEVFNYVGVNFLLKKATGDTMIHPDKYGFLLDTFKQFAEKDKTFAEAVVYLMSVFLNVWVIFYYFVRDIILCYLFIIFPVIAIFLPFRKGTVEAWFKEVISNTMTQTIHAFLFTFVIAAAVLLEPTFKNEMFVITAFASIIPGTAVLKKILGFEGSLGLSNLAGFGTVLGAMQLTKNLTSNIKQGASGIAGGLGELSDARSQERANNKNTEVVRTSATSQSLPNVNSALTNNASDMDISNKKREAWRKIQKSAGSMVGGSTIGTIGTIGGSAYGLNGATVLGAAGVSMGGGIGKLGGMGVGLAHSAIDYEIEKDKAIYDNDELSEQEALDQFTGLTSPMLQNTEFKEQEQKAILGRKRLEALGLNQLANWRYTKKAPARKSAEDIKGLKNALLYQDKDQSVLYNQKEDGTREILSTWGGEASLGDKRVQGMVSFNDGKLEISNNRLGQLSSMAESTADNTDVTKIVGYDDMVMSEYDKQVKFEEKGWRNQANSYAENELKYDPKYLEKQDALNRYSEETKSMYEMDKYQQLKSEGFSEGIARSQSKEYAKNAIKTDSRYLNLQKDADNYYNDNLSRLSNSKFNELKTVNSTGIENNARKTVEGNLRKDIAKRELNNLQKAELTKLEGIRGNSGLNNLILESGLHHFNDKIAPQREMEAIRGTLLENLNETEIPLQINPIPDGSVGYCYEGQNGTTYYAVDEMSGQAQLLGFGEGSNECGTATCNYSAVRYEMGKAYVDETKYAMEGNSFEYAPSNMVTDFNASKISNLTQNISPNTDLIITTNMRGDKGSYNVVNARTGEYIGAQPIYQQYLSKEQDGQSYHVQVNAVGDYLQHYNGQITDKDMHMTYTSKPENVQSALDETAQTKLRYENIQKEKAMLEQYLSMTNDFNIDSTVNND